MKKILSLLIIAALLFSFAACGKTEPAEITDEPTDETAVEPTAEVTAEPTAEPTVEPTAEPTPEPTPEPTDDLANALAAPLTEILDSIREGYFPGTAGCSLNGAAKAAALCDLFSEFSADAESVKIVCKNYFAALEEADRSAFAQQMLGIHQSFTELRDSGTDILETAGYTPIAAPWDFDTMEPLFAATLECVGMGFYADILNSYREALESGMSYEDMIAADLNYTTRDSGLDGVGYCLRDVNADGVPEFLLCAVAEKENTFLYGMVFELYSVDAFGAPVRVFTSGERDRYYLAGETLFAHEGSSSAFDSFADTEIFDGDTMTVTGEGTEERLTLELITLRGE